MESFPVLVVKIVETAQLGISISQSEPLNDKDYPELQERQISLMLFAAIAAAVY